jgi:hypothetical protein
LQDACKRLYCPAPRVYKDGACESLFTEGESIGYEAFFTLTPDTALNRVQVIKVAHHLPTNITVGGAYLCRMGVFAKVKDELPSGDVEYLLVHIQVVKLYLHNIEITASKLVQTLTKQTMFDYNISGVGLVTFHSAVEVGQYRSQDSDDKKNAWDADIPYTDPYDGIDLPVAYMSGNLLDDPCKHTVVVQVSDFPYCPQIELDTEEYNVTFETGSIRIPGLNWTLSRTEYIPVRAHPAIRVCADEYLARAEQFSCNETDCNLKPNKLNTDVDIKGILSFVCTVLSILCLLITLMTYCTFPMLRTLPGKNNMALISTLLCAQIIYQFGIGQTHTGLGCKILGALILFLWLASLFWMNVCSLHMMHVFLTIPQQTTSSGALPMMLYAI